MIIGTFDMRLTEILQENLGLIDGTFPWRRRRLEEI